jgi:hypothetical protein
MPPSGGNAEVFTERDYRGAYAALNFGIYNVGRETGSVGNDTISSLKVAPGYQVTVYTDTHATGSSTTFTSDTPYVGDNFNDKISSIEITSTMDATSGRRPEDQIVFVQPPPV